MKVTFIFYTYFLYYFQSLVEWDYHNPYALLNVIDELLKMYKCHQEQIIHAYDRLLFEYSSLTSDQSGLSTEDIELHTLRFEVSLKCQ